MARIEDAEQRIDQLRQDGKTGVQIGEELKREGFSMETARKAFFQQSYVVAAEGFTEEKDLLHVSNQPMEPGVAAIVASAEPRGLPEVIWPKQKKKN